MKILLHRKSGFSLMEVLVAMLILLIGVTSVLALFPVGVARVRQAVLDTRTAFYARSMWDVVHVKGMLNDPLHLDPSPPANVAPNPPYENFLQSPFYGAPLADLTPPPLVGLPDSYHFNVVDPANPTAVIEPSGTTASITRLDSTSIVTPFLGVPLLIDPILVEAQHGQTGTTPNLNGPGFDANRQQIIDFDTTGIGTLGYTQHPLRVVTTWEAASIADAAVRRSYVRRWFSSSGDVNYNDDWFGAPVVPNNASVTDPGGSFPIPDTGASGITAQRTYPYSWALMIQSELTSGGGNPAPPAFGSVDIVSNARILVFYKRSLAEPFQTAFAALEDGDPRVTLRHPPGQKPHIRRGTWLAVVTITGTPAADETPPDPIPGRLDGTSSTPLAITDSGTSTAAGVATTVHRSFDFFRVADFEDSVFTGDPVVLITLESTPIGYNPPGTRALNSPEYPDPAPNGGTAAGKMIYFPIIIFDGLQEVFGPETF